MVDRLQISTGKRESPPTVPEKVAELGFDAVSIHVMPAGVSIGGGVALMGTAMIYQVPVQIDRAELREFAFHSSLEGKFTVQCWWQLQIQGGATQEVIFDSRIFRHGAGGSVFPDVTAGFQYGRYGSLHIPANLTAQLRPGQQLVAPVFTSDSVPLINLTVYARARGVIYQAH